MGQGTHILSLEARVLEKNDRIAEGNRAWLAGRGVLALNLMSSPGAGKTTLLERTLGDLSVEFPMAVVEGDQETTYDAERISKVRVPVVQINTGQGCHLEADMVAQGLRELNPQTGSVVFIENVGNLVCPALFDLGEAAKVVILSVTEGEDKPRKYPHMFHGADLVLINKVDLLPYIHFDLDRCFNYLKEIAHHADIIQISSSTGQGLPEWYDWLRDRRQHLENSSWDVMTKS
jgi:hydrogenase nickel incorporation protein HypB